MGSIQKSLLILIAIGSLTACETYQVKPDVPCPARPILEAFVAEELDSMTDSAKSKAANNQIKLKAYAKKLEARAGCNE